MPENIYVAVKEQTTLNDEGRNKRPDQNRCHARNVKRVAHILAISNGHRGLTLAIPAAGFNSIRFLVQLLINQERCLGWYQDNQRYH